MARQWYYPLYWSSKQPDPAGVVMTRYNDVQNGAGIKGEPIGSLGTGTTLKIDKAEVDNGWTRIISVDGHHPVPFMWQQDWEDRSKPESEWEWWIDNSSFAPPEAPSEKLLIEVTKNPDGTWDIRKV